MLTADEMALMLRIRRATLYKLVKRSNIPTLRMIRLALRSRSNRKVDATGRAQFLMRANGWSRIRPRD
jgi:hypothetical protein